MAVVRNFKLHTHAETRFVGLDAGSCLRLIVRLLLGDIVREKRKTLIAEILLVPLCFRLIFSGMYGDSLQFLSVRKSGSQSRSVQSRQPVPDL